MLLPLARKLLRESIELHEMMYSLQDKIVGQLRIACSTTTGKYILPQFAARFHDRHPEVTINILRCSPETILPSLMEEEANLGVVSYDLCGGKLECQEFFLDHIVLIVPSDHPWTSRSSIDLSELLDEPFILRESTSGTRRVLLAELGKHDIALNDMRVFMELGNAEAIEKTVEAGFGVPFFSRLAAAWALELGSVWEIPVTGIDLGRRVYMVRSSLQAPNRAIEAFWDYVHDPSNADLLRMAER
jgi:DNA-binding transcriptional LysR family regulator